MKAAKFLLAAIFFAAAVCIGTSARAEDGLNDSHGVWRNAEYWHANHPEWVYRYHPEWAVDRQEWWVVDHRGHPEWFYSPYWRRYPVWTYGAYDRNHIWRDSGWWRKRDPGWFYAHHPEWAEAHPGWIRYDHGQHPEWFHSSYWGEHPRDWNHPDDEYRRELSRNVEYQHSHAEGSEAANNHGVYHGGVDADRDHYHAGATGAEHSNAAGGQYHASTAHSSTYHPASTYHPPSTNHSTSSTSSASHSSGGGGHGKH